LRCARTIAWFHSNASAGWLGTFRDSKPYLEFCRGLSRLDTSFMGNRLFCDGRMKAKAGKGFLVVRKQSMLPLPEKCPHCKRLSGASNAGVGHEFQPFRTPSNLPRQSDPVRSRTPNLHQKQPQVVGLRTGSCVSGKSLRRKRCISHISGNFVALGQHGAIN